MSRPDGLERLPVQPAKSRLLLTLVVDTSTSMAEGNRIHELNQALHNWRDELLKNDHIRRHGEIALVTFGKDGVLAVDPSGRIAGPAQEPFVPVSQFNPPTLEAGGVTPMVEALQLAFRLLATRRQHLRSSGIQMANRPLVYLITDGVPTDEEGYRSDRWQNFAPVIRQQESGLHLLFFAFGVYGADQEVLQGLAPSSWRFLANFSFAEVLTLVSASIESVSAHDGRSVPAETIYNDVNTRLDREARIRDWLKGNG